MTATEVGTLLRGVRAWERRNFIHRLYAGEADRTRAFKDEEIATLAPALSKALAQATPAQRAYFHLSHATDQGEEETTNGWLSVRGPIRTSPSARCMIDTALNPTSVNMTVKCRTCRKLRQPSM